MFLIRGVFFVIIGIYYSLCGLFEILSPKLRNFLSENAMIAIDRMLYKLALGGTYVLITLFFMFALGGLFGVVL